MDSAALAHALRAGRLAGAGIDVFEMEPPVPSNHPLFGAPNLVATPHVAFVRLTDADAQGALSLSLVTHRDTSCASVLRLRDSMLAPAPA